MGTSLQTLRGISFVNLTYKQVGFRICLCFESRVMLLARVVPCLRVVRLEWAFLYTCVVMAQ